MSRRKKPEATEEQIAVETLSAEDQARADEEEASRINAQINKMVKTPRPKGKRSKKAQTAAKPKAATARPKRTKERTKRERAPRAGKISGLDAAAQFLGSARKPHNVKDVLAGAVALGWESAGATPAATLSAAMTREIAKKGAESRFAKAGPGLFTSNR